MEKFYLPEMIREEVKEVVDRAVLLVPVSTIEQHGPHLPLHTDIDNTVGILMKVAENLNPEPRTLVAPPVWFSFSPFDPQVYPGTIMIRKDVFSEALNDILESYLRGGFKKIVVVNGHGGGTERRIPQIIDKLNTKKSSIWGDSWQIPNDARVVGFHWFCLLSNFATEELADIRGANVSLDWHSGDMETSLQLFLRPELVDMSKAKKGATAVGGTKFAPIDLDKYHWQFVIDGYGARRGGGEVDGVSGDPTTSSREKGEKIFKLAVRKISEFVQEFAKH